MCMRTYSCIRLHAVRCVGGTCMYAMHACMPVFLYISVCGAVHVYLLVRGGAHDRIVYGSCTSGSDTSLKYAIFSMDACGYILYKAEEEHAILPLCVLM